MSLENQKLKDKGKGVVIEFIDQDIELEEELELYSYSIRYHNNNLLNMEFLLEFTDGYKLLVLEIIDTSLIKLYF